MNNINSPPNIPPENPKIKNNDTDHRLNRVSDEVALSELETSKGDTIDYVPGTKYAPKLYLSGAVYSMDLRQFGDRKKFTKFLQTTPNRATVINFLKKDNDEILATFSTDKSGKLVLLSHAQDVNVIITHVDRTSDGTIIGAINFEQN